MGPFWDRFGVVLESVLGSFLEGFGIVLGSFWDRFGIVSGSCWDRLGIVLASFWERFWVNPVIQKKNAVNPVTAITKIIRKIFFPAL